MRVCFFIPALSDGGAQRQCIYLLNELQDRDDVELVLVTLREGVHDPSLRTDRLKWVRLGNRSGFDPRTLFSLWRLLKHERSDLLVTWLKASDTIGGIVRRVMPRLKWVMTERSAWYAPTRRNRLRWFAARAADAIVANSEAGRVFWLGRGVRGKVTAVDNIVRTGMLLPDDEPLPEVVAVGRLVSNKNVLTTARAISIAVAGAPGIRGVIIGQGDLEPAVRSIADANKRLEYLGFRHDAERFIAGARVLVSMSRLEGMPNVVLEAIAHRTLPVLSDIPEHIEVVGADYPYLVPRDADPNVVASKIVAALNSSNARADIERASFRVSAMTASVVADRYMRIFRETLASENRRY